MSNSKKSDKFLKLVGKHQEQKKKETCGFNHTGRVATTAVITGLITTRGYNRG